MSGGFKNLRAIFESGNDATSPPDRGRSPAQSIGAGSNGSSPQPRPLSKVRTSFVTVEKSGQLGSQLGLRRDTSGEPSMAKRRPSFSIDEGEEPKAIEDRKQSIAMELDARKNRAVAEIIPEVAIETEDADKVPDQSARKQRGRESTRPQLDEKKPITSIKEAVKPSNGTLKPKAAVTKVPEKETTSRPATRPAPISTAKTNTTAKASPKTTKAPVPKTPTTPKSQAGHDTEKRPGKLISRTSLAPKQSSNTSSRPATSVVQKAAPKTKIGASPPQTGFVKPKPRSPTRPVALPASLTAHTASSGSKTATAAAPQHPAGRQSLSRASGHSQPTKSLQGNQAASRSPSRTSTTTTSKSTLTRKPSTLSKTSTNRPSLGPPPAQLKKRTSRQSLAAPADEGFLARMMRSTESSASKTNEKVPTTPPKSTQPVRKSTPKHEPPKTELPKREEAATVKSTPSKLKVKAKESVAPKAAPKASAKDSPKTPRSDEVSKTKLTVGETKADKQASATTPIVLPEDVASDPAGSSANDADTSNSTAEVAAEHELPRAAAITLPEKTKPSEEAAITTIEDVERVDGEPEAQISNEGERKEAENAEDNTSKNSDGLEAPAQTEATGLEENEEIVTSITEQPEVPSEYSAVNLDQTSAKGKAQKDENADGILSPEIITSELLVEDPEDVRAREEIAKLNAEVTKGTEAEAPEVAI